MIEKHTFEDILNSLEYYTCGVDKLEQSLGVTFDNNFITNIMDNMLCALAHSFFTKAEIDDLDHQVQIETVKDMLYHFAFTGEFGLKINKLQRLYVENENKSNERAFDACTAEQLYVIINRYLHPQEVAETYTIHC